jgi:hypothetical protein
MRRQREQTKPEWYGELAEQALRSAVAKLIAERRRAGESLVIWQDGEVVCVPASEVPDPGAEAALISSRRSRRR